MTNLHGILSGTDGHTDTRSAHGTTVQHARQEIQDMTPQQDAEASKEAPLGMSYGYLKFDGVHQQGTT